MSETLWPKSCYPEQYLKKKKTNSHVKLVAVTGSTTSRTLCSAFRTNRTNSIYMNLWIDEDWTSFCLFDDCHLALVTRLFVRGDAKNDTQSLWLQARNRHKNLMLSMLYCTRRANKFEIFEHRISINIERWTARRACVCVCVSCGYFYKYTSMFLYPNTNAQVIIMWNERQ